MFKKSVAIPVIPEPPKQVTNSDGLELCKILYTELSSEGFYPALTGGLLYKSGERKDIDIVIFRNRQLHASFEMKEIEHLLMKVGLSDFTYYGFVTKAKWKGFTVDLFNPETQLEFDGEDCYGFNDMEL